MREVRLVMTSRTSVINFLRNKFCNLLVAGSAEIYNVLNFISPTKVATILKTKKFLKISLVRAGV